MTKTSFIIEIRRISEIPLCLTGLCFFYIHGRFSNFDLYMSLNTETRPKFPRIRENMELPFKRAWGLCSTGGLSFHWQLSTVCVVGDEPKEEGGLFTIDLGWRIPQKWRRARIVLRSIKKEKTSHFENRHSEEMHNKGAYIMGN